MNPPRTSTDAQTTADGKRRSTAVGPIDVDELIQRFESDWSAHPESPPNIADFLAGGVGELSNGADSVLVELVKIDLEYRWRSRPGHVSAEKPPEIDRFPVEYYLQQFPKMATDRAIVHDLIGEEFWVRMHSPLPPTIKEFEARFPDCREQVQSHLTELQQQWQQEFAAKNNPLGQQGTQPRHDADDQARELPTRQPVALLSSIPQFPGYEVLEILGQGGGGIVCLAKQHALRRNVALKIMRTRGWQNDHEESRFRFESESAARLRHPNIVEIYEFGSYDGHWFCAMEWADGGGLDQLLQRRRLTPREAAELVSRLASAMHYAHRMGVIHRDLKPANILLQSCEPISSGEPLEAQLDGSAPLLPKIADFGLARALDDDSNRSRQTQDGTLLGTPSYMAPEQAIGRTNDVGPAVDIYSLGAILYEMLSERPPFVGDSTLETIRQVIHEEPVPPSKLRIGVPADLSVICLKCLEKEPDQRYTTALDLADDLDRFLAGHVIAARPATWWQRTDKWVRRNPALAALFSVIALSIVVLSVAGVRHNWRLRKALDNTAAEKQRADLNLEQAFTAVNQMLDNVGFVTLDGVPEMESTRALLAKEAIGFYQQLIDSQPQPAPEHWRMLQNAYLRLGMIQFELGQLESARQHFVEALDEQERIMSQLDLSEQDDYQLALCHMNLGVTLNHLSRSTEAQKHTRQAIDILESHPPSNLAEQRSAALAWNNLGTMFSDSDNIVHANLRALSLRKAIVEQYPDSLDAVSDLAQTQHNLGMAHLDAGRHEAAQENFEQAIAGWRSNLEKSPRRWMDQRSLASCNESLHSALLSLGKISESESALRESLAIRMNLSDRFPTSASLKDGIAQSHHNLSTMYHATGRLDEAEASLRSAVAIRSSLDDGSVGGAIRLAEDRGTLAHVLHGLGRLDESRAMYEQSLALYRQLCSEHPRELRIQSSAASASMNYANLLRELGEMDRGVEEATEAVNKLSPLFREYADNQQIKGFLLNAHGCRAQCFEAAKKFTESLSDWNRVVELATAGQRQQFRNWRLPTMARANHALVSAEVDDLAASPETRGDTLYNGLCACSLAVESAREDSSLPPADQNVAIAKYWSAARSLLSDERLRAYLMDPAVMEHAQSDTDLNALRAEEKLDELLQRGQTSR